LRFRWLDRATYRYATWWCDRYRAGTTSTSDRRLWNDRRLGLDRRLWNNRRLRLDRRLWNNRWLWDNRRL